MKPGQSADRELAIAQFRLLFGHLQQFRGVGGFLLPVHPLFSLPLWVPPKPLSKLGNIRNHDISRVFPVIAQSGLKKLGMDLGLLN